MATKATDEREKGRFILIFITATSRAPGGDPGSQTEDQKFTHSPDSPVPRTFSIQADKR